MVLVKRVKKIFLTTLIISEILPDQQSGSFQVNFQRKHGLRKKFSSLSFSTCTREVLKNVRPPFHLKLGPVLILNNGN